MANMLNMQKVRGVAFDMDGTLTVSELDFDRIRAECGVPPGESVLEHMESLPEQERHRVESILGRHERDAAASSGLRDGAREVLQELRARGFRTALLTRNSAESVRTVLRRFGLEFDCWLSREHSEPKPSPEPVLKIAERLGVLPDQLMVVGDYVFDVLAGHAGGALTAFVRSERPIAPPPETDVIIEDLHVLLELLPHSVE